MALPWALAVLSLLPLLEAQSPACANLTAKPITNATLDWLSGRWFYIGSVFVDPAFKQMVQKVQASDFSFTPNLTQDTILFQQYLSLEDHCEYNSSVLWVHRENATLSRFDGGKKIDAQLLLQDFNSTYLLAFSMDDETKRGLSFYADKPEATPEQLEGFREALECKGMDKAEIMYTDWKKDQCEPLRRQHELERKKEPESSPRPPAGGHSSEPPAP
ncbi:alpha-1-acid glycoprotein [Ictidomys tridecemlineatus]|uniref:Alpha-1-acid glycoprotein-like n=1 Tax=Ictidomys tridecemlineatus TaxID=43179 RepID=I3MJR5_ICTTR|nr:alpha-1-acid glycoprotein-like [Ictidomys tridecemlineatus]